MRRAAAVLMLLGGCATMHARPAAAPAEGTRGWAAWLAGDPAAAERAFATAGDDDARAALRPRASGARARRLGPRLESVVGACSRARRTIPAIGGGARSPTPAAHKLEQLVGEVPGERAQAERLAALDGAQAADRRAAAPSGHARALRAAARARGRGARLRSRARLPRLVVRRRRLRQPAAARPGDAVCRPTATATRARCARWRCAAARWRSRPSTGAPGVLYGVQWVQAPRAGDALVTVETDAPWRLYVDGALAFDALSPERVPPRVRRAQRAAGGRLAPRGAQDRRRRRSRRGRRGAVGGRAARGVERRRGARAGDPAARARDRGARRDRAAARGARRARCQARRQRRPRARRLSRPRTRPSAPATTTPATRRWRASASARRSSRRRCCSPRSCGARIRRARRGWRAIAAAARSSGRWRSIRRSTARATTWRSIELNGDKPREALARLDEVEASALVALLLRAAAGAQAARLAARGRRRARRGAPPRSRGVPGARGRRAAAARAA